MKRAIGAGLLGAVVLILWTFLINGILGFQSRIDMKQIPAEREVYELLKEHVVAPGRYICNPEVTSEGRFPGGEPVFSILYGGVGHEAAGWLMFVGFIVFLLTPVVGAWMLSRTSQEFLSSYTKKVLFFTAIGLLLALFHDLSSMGIGGYPMKDAFALAIHDIVLWTLVGFVVAWRIGSKREET